MQCQLFQRALFYGSESIFSDNILKHPNSAKDDAAKMTEVQSVLGKLHLIHDTAFKKIKEEPMLSNFSSSLKKQSTSSNATQDRKL